MSDHPASMTYAASVDAIAALQEQERRLLVHERCLSTLLTHGHPGEYVLLYFHGFTSCPAQGRDLATRFFEAGFNAYLPRMIGHGGRGLQGFSMDGLTPDYLVEFAGEAMDIARGLGDKVIVIGLSAGGAIAAWIAQYRADVEMVVLVSPFFGPYALPLSASGWLADATLRVPSLVVGWNPLANVTPEQVDYPFAKPETHPLAAFMLLGRIIAAGARHQAPMTKNISVLLNQSDLAVSNIATLELVQAWESHGLDVDVATLPKQHRLPHDLINPHERGGNVDLVYGMLIEMIMG